ICPADAVRHLARSDGGRSLDLHLQLAGRAPAADRLGAVSGEIGISYAVIPGRVEDANPESRDSPMCNCTSEVWSGACHRAAQKRRPDGTIHDAQLRIVE